MDFLGFAFIVLVVVTQPQLVSSVFQALAGLTRSLGDRAPEFWMNVKTLTVGIAFGLSIGLFLFETAWFFGLLPSENTPWWFWGYYLVIGPGQLAFAIWNWFAGSTRVEDALDHLGNPVFDPDGNPVRVRRMRFGFMENIFSFASLEGLTAWARPGLWYGITSIMFLVQGYHLISYMLKPETGLYYGDKLYLGVLATASHLVHGLMMAALVAVLTGMIVRGFRFLERSLTIVAKLAIRLAPGIVEDNALAELGGEIDVVDEQNAASVSKSVLMMPVISALLLDMGVLAWPNQTIAWLIVILLIINGISHWMLGRTNAAANVEAESSRRMTFRVIHRVAMPVMISCLLIGTFLSNFPTGRRTIVLAKHYWYGLAYHTYYRWYEYLIAILFCAIIFRIFIFVWKKANEKIAEIEAKPKEEDKWTLRFLYGGKIATQIITVLSAAIAIFCLFGSIQGMRGVSMLSLERIEEKDVVGIEDVKYDISEFENSGKITVTVNTREHSAGVVEFENPEALKTSGLPGFVPLIIQTPLMERQFDRDAGRQHSATFYVPKNKKVRFRIAMRYAGIQKHGDRVELASIFSPSTDTEMYGQVESTPFVSVGSDPAKKPEKVDGVSTGYWDGFCAWWHNLWTWGDDDDRRPERTVVVHRYEPRPAPATAPRGTGCKVKPLKVVPSLRDEVASARSGR
jgi:hypothetical protein